MMMRMHACMLQGARPLAKTIPGGSGNSGFMSAAGSDTTSQDPYSLNSQYDMRGAYKASDGTSWGEHSDWNDTANTQAPSVGHGAEGHEASPSKTSRRWTGNLHFLPISSHTHIMHLIHYLNRAKFPRWHLSCLWYRGSNYLLWNIYVPPDSKHHDMSASYLFTRTLGFKSRPLPFERRTTCHSCAMLPHQLMTFLFSPTRSQSSSPPPGMNPPPPNTLIIFIKMFQTTFST
jgi:hypothetical protein